jgi:purine-binding chemotaxis protein CheW
VSGHFVIFVVAEHSCALPAEQVEEIVPLAALVRPPNLPSILDGFLNLRGTALPVLQLRRLLGFSVSEPEVYSPLIIAKAEGGRVALWVDRVEDVVAVKAENLQPFEESTSFNGCAQAQFSWNNCNVTVLSANRLLLNSEKERLAEFKARMQERLDQIDGAQRA